MINAYKKEGKTIDGFKFDNFTAFHSDYIRERASQLGIPLSYTAPYQPQSLQAEETNYFLDSHIRQMLSAACLPELVWPLLQHGTKIVAILSIILRLQVSLYHLNPLFKAPPQFQSRFVFGCDLRR